MYSFDFERPESVDAASGSVADDDSARFIAGGMSLLPALKLRLSQVSKLVDLRHVPGISGIRYEDGKLIVGAMTRHVEVANDPLVQKHLPVLSTTASGIGDRQIRNRGTMGGSLANNDPAADYPAAALALNAVIRTNRRDIVADDYFIDVFTTALEEGELIREIAYPLPAAAAYVKYAQPASLFALVGVFVVRWADGSVRVAVTGAGASVFRVTEMEEALSASFVPETARAVQMSSEGLNSDVHGDADYRAHLISVMAERAVRACLA